MRYKVSVIGAGNVGASVTQRVFETGYCDVALVDAKKGVAEGKALDILESGPVLGIDSNIVGSTLDYSITAKSDIVVITAGITRAPGMSRNDLLEKNMRILSDVTKEVVNYSPKATIIVVTNPLDAMVQLVYKISGLQKNRVIGMAGVLDSARFRTFIAQELKVSVQDINAYVLGGHGDQMVPLITATNVAGVPITQLIKPDRIEQIVQRTRDGGAEIVELLGTSGYYAPAAATVEMVEAILLDKKQTLPCAVLLEGQYGIEGYYAGVPAVLGENGIERVVEVPVSDSEQKAFESSVNTVKELVSTLESFNT